MNPLVRKYNFTNIIAYQRLFIEPKPIKNYKVMSNEETPVQEESVEVTNQTTDTMNAENENKPAESRINIIPVNGNVVLKLHKVDQKTATGIIKSAKQIEDEKKNLPKFVELVAVGAGSRFEIGQYVMISPGAQYVKITDTDGEDYAVMEDFQILAIATGQLLAEAKTLAAKKVLKEFASGATLKPIY
jgi:co-chaperonin GroES (HSP10)